MDNYNSVGLYTADADNIKKQKTNIFLIGIFIGCAIIIFIVFNEIYWTVLKAVENAFDEDTREFLLNDSVYNSLTYICYSVLCIFCSFLIMRIPIKKITKYEECYRKPKKGTNVLMVIVIALAMCVIANYVAGIFSTFSKTFFGVEPTGDPDVVGDGTEFSVISYIMSILSIAVTPALVEEFAFRGVLMQSLRKYGDMFAVVVSSVIFAIIHANFVQIPFALVVGFALGYAVVRTGSIWVGVIVHFLNNAWSTTMSYLYNYVGSAVYGVVSTFVTLMLCVLGIIIAVKLYKKDVKRGWGDGVLKKSETNRLSTGQRILFFFISPTLLLGLTPFIYSAFISFG